MRISRIFLAALSVASLDASSLQTSIQDFALKYAKTNGIGSLEKWNALRGDEMVSNAIGHSHEVKLSPAMRAMFLASECNVLENRIASVGKLCRYVEYHGDRFVSAGEKLIQTYYGCLSNRDCLYVSSLLPLHGMGVVCSSSVGSHNTSQSLKQFVIKSSVLFAHGIKEFDPMLSQVPFATRIEDFAPHPSLGVRKILATVKYGQSLGPSFETLLQNTVSTFAIIKKDENLQDTLKLNPSMSDETATGLGVIMGLGAAFGDAIPQPFLDLLFNAVICLKTPNCSLEEKPVGLINKVTNLFDSNKIKGLVEKMEEGIKRVLRPSESVAGLGELKAMAAIRGPKGR